MSSVMGIDTAIGLAHWNLRGGWKKTLIVTGGFTLVIFGLMITSLQLRSRYSTPADVFAAWRTGLLLLQSAVLVLFTASRVAVAIRSDITLRMFESHKLMPIPAMTVVSGYLWGPTGQAVIVAAANFLLGLGATFFAGFGLRMWLVPNLVLFIFAVFTWVMAAFCGFFARAAWAGVFGLILVAGLSQGAIFLILPCLGMLSGPTLGMTIFAARARTVELDWTMIVSMAAQAATGAIFYLGAARKYRCPEDSALGVRAALLLLVLWTALSALGIRHADEFRNPVFGNPRSSIAPLVVSTAFLMLVGVTPIANAARHRRARHYSPLIGLLCAGIILALPLLIFQRYTVPTVGLTAFTLIASLLSMCYLLRILYRASRQGWAVVAFWVVIAWFAPLLLDLGLWTARYDSDDFKMGTLSSVSPIGSLIMVFDGPTRTAVVGVIVQLLIAIFWMALFHGTRRNAYVRTIHQAG